MPRISPRGHWKSRAATPSGTAFGIASACCARMCTSRLAGERYDLIVSNPPYVPAVHLATLPPEHRHEPSLGLDGGDDGLAIVSRILEGATEHLTEHGTLVVEAGEAAPAAEARYPRLPFVWLEFERGGEGVFLLEAQDLPQCCPESSASG